MKKLVILIMVFCLASSAVVFSQSAGLDYRLRDGFGVFGNFNFNNHAADFRALPGVPTCCPNFGNGNGYGPSGGFLMQLPLSREFFLNGRLGYFNHDGVLTSRESSPRTIVNVNGDPVQGVIEHKIDATIASIAFEPLVGFRLWKDFSLMAGLHGGYNIRKHYDQSEKLVTPASGTFENGTRSRLPSSGELPDAMKYDLAVLGGISYDLPLTSDKTWLLSPEAFYSYSLLPVIDNSSFQKDWKINTVRAGLALKYLPYEVEPGPNPYVVQATSSPLLADVEAFGLDDDNIERPVAQVKVEEFLSTQIKPLLTYVFFDDNSSELPRRYRRLTRDEASQFTIEQLYHKGVLDTYYHVLNIIGKRMTANSDAKIALDGCNNGVGAEKNNLDLSRRRADAVKDYLVHIWNINPDRILVSERNLPQDPSNPNDPDGIAENRRVEITANEFDIIAPIIINDTLRSVNPPVVRFKNRYQGSAGVDQWALAATFHGDPLAKFDGKDNVPDVVDWKFADNESSIPRADAVDYQFVVRDKDGQTYQTPIKNLPVQQVTIQKKRRDRVADKYIDHYSLILFQFDKSYLGVFNQKVVDLIKDRTKPSSTIRVLGFTDRMGNDEHNRKLSLDRANIVADALGADKSNVKGIGEKQLVYDNDLPEGRFYCRKVDVIVETPVEDEK